MEQSTQWGVSLPNTFPMKKHLKSRNPALKIPRRHEAVATDTVFSDTPAVDSGVKQAQVLVGRDERNLMQCYTLACTSMPYPQLHATLSHVCPHYWTV